MFQVPGARFQIGRSEFRVPSSELECFDPNLEPGTRNPEPRSGTRNPELPGEAGFTLLEVMIALAILGMTFAFAMELLATGVRSAKTSEEYVQAALLARQKVAQVAVLRSTGGEADGGEFGGGFRWVSEVHPLPQEEELPARLYQVRVRVTWPGRRGEKLLDLYTMRMAVDEAKLGQTQAVQPAGRGSAGRRQ